MLTRCLEDHVTYVNAPVIAADRGIDVRLVTDSDAGSTATSSACAGPHRRHVAARRRHADRPAAGREARRDRRLRPRGAALRPPGRPPLRDRPGVVGAVGGVLGDAGVNIAGMQVARYAVGGKAVMVLTVDASPGAEVLAGIAREIEADLVESVDLRLSRTPPRPPGRCIWTCARLSPKLRSPRRGVTFPQPQVPPSTVVSTYAEASGLRRASRPPARRSISGPLRTRSGPGRWTGDAAQSIDDAREAYAEVARRSRLADLGLREGQADRAMVCGHGPIVARDSARAPDDRAPGAARPGLSRPGRAAPG